MAFQLFLRAFSQQDGQPLQVAGDFQFDRTQPSFNTPTDPLHGFRRLIFIDPETQLELITLDVIPGDPRNLVQTTAGDTDGVLVTFVDCAIRCRLLDDTEVILLHVEIMRMPQFKTSNLGFKSLRFKNSAGAGPELCPNGCEFSSLRAKLDSAAQAPLTVSPVHAAGPSPVETQIQEFSSQAALWSWCGSIGARVHCWRLSACATQRSIGLCHSGLSKAMCLHTNGR